MKYNFVTICIYNVKWDLQLNQDCDVSIWSPRYELLTLYLVVPGIDT